MLNSGSSRSKFAGVRTGRGLLVRDLGAAKLEALEGRQLMAAVSWDGGAGDNLWHSAANWSTDAVPTLSDDVTIDAAGSPTILLTAATGNRSVNSLVMRDNVSISGGATLTLATTALIEGGATLALTNGKLAGGAWTVVNGGLSTDSSVENRLTGLTWNGPITLPDTSDRLSIGAGVTINGVMTVSGASAEIGLLNGAVLNSEVVFPGTATNRRIGAVAGNITYTLGSNANVHGGAFTIGGQYGGSAWGGVTVVNQGTIAADVAGQLVSISPATFSTTGTLNVSGGAMTVAPTTSWSTNGATVNVSAGTLTIGGTYTTAGGIGTWTRTGGAVNVTGVINNEGGVLNLGAATGVWTLSAGSITGGTVNIQAGGELSVDSNGSNRLSNLTFNGGITLADANDRLSIGTGVTINGVLTLSGASSELGMVNGAVLNSEVVFPGTATNRRIGAVAGNITYTLGSSANVHGGTFTIGGQYAGSAWGGVTVVNQGTIAADVAGQTVTINPANFNSSGVLNIWPGNMTITPNSAWSSAGSTVNVNGGTLVIAGTYTTASGIGTWTRAGGAVNVTGVIHNTDATLTLNAATGVWNLTGGSITGGTVTIQAGGDISMDSNGGNRLSNLVFNGDLTLADANDRLSLGQNVTINGVTTLSGASSELGMVNGAVLNSEVVFPGTAGNRRIGAVAGNITYTFGPSANIHGGTFTIGGQYGGSAWGGVTVVNQGVISADTAGQTVTINPANFNSTGVLNIAPGNMTLAPGNAWSTSGSTLNINGGTLTMAGTYVTAAGIGTWARTGGVVNLTGAIDNTGGVLTLNASTGVWNLTGGSISGGIVTIQAGGGISMDSNGANRLSNLVFNGDITLADANDRLSFGQTVTVNGVTTLSGAGSELGLVNGAVLNSEVVFPGTAGNRRIGATSGNSTYTLGGSANVHGGPFTIGGQYAGSAWGGVTVVNMGTIAADVAGQTATINPAIFTNIGTLTAGPGNVTVNTSQTWSTTGQVNINNVTFSIDGTLVTAGGIGTWNRVGGVVNVPGTIQNAKGTINLNAGTGEWTLTGGLITGGVVNIAAGGGLGVNSNGINRLQNTTVNGNIVLGDASDRLAIGQSVTVNGVITVSGAGAEIGLAADAVFNGEIAFPGNVSNRRIGATSGNMTYTLGPSANIHGGSFVIGGQYAGSAWGGVTVINQGTIAAEAAGQTVTINPVTFVNTGTVAAAGGMVVIAPTSAVFTNGGVLSANAGSRVNVTGALVQEAGARVRVKTNGLGEANMGRVVVSGPATLNGILEVQLTDGFAPECMNSGLLTAASVVGEFSGAMLPPPPGDHQALVVYIGNEVRFAFSPPSDYNQDGVLNSQDFFDFLSAFFAQQADFNDDGVTNSQDFFDFLTDFFEGC